MDMNSLHENIKKYRIKLGLTQTELAGMVGYADKSMIAKIESGKATPPYKKLVQFGDIFGVSPMRLMGYGSEADDAATREQHELLMELRETRPDLLVTRISKLQGEQLPESDAIPLLGEIRYENPLLCKENVTSYINAPDWINAAFAITSPDESMLHAGILDGSTVFIRQTDVENGQLCAVLADGRIDIRRIFHGRKSITLQAAHPDYPPLVFTGDDMDDVTILGKAVYVLNELR